MPLTHLYSTILILARTFNKDGCSLTSWSFKLLLLLFIIRLPKLILVIGIYDSVIFPRFIKSLIIPSLQCVFQCPEPWDSSLSTVSLSHISSKQHSDSIQQLSLEYQQGEELATWKRGNDTNGQDRAAQSLGTKKNRHK